jgi:hypothetical protein
VNDLSGLVYIFTANDSHSSPASTERCFENDWKTVLCHEVFGFVD